MQLEDRWVVHREDGVTSLGAGRVKNACLHPSYPQGEQKQPAVGYGQSRPMCGSTHKAQPEWSSELSVAQSPESSCV